LDALEEGGEEIISATSKTTYGSTTTAQGKLIDTAKKCNQVVMANLTVAFTSKGSMSLIYEAKEGDWPMGLAHKVVLEMKQKYHPENTMKLPCKLS
jgi:hypothetical protein